MKGGRMNSAMHFGEKTFGTKLSAAQLAVLNTKVSVGLPIAAGPAVPRRSRGSLRGAPPVVPLAAGQKPANPHRPTRNHRH
jgi:hypothetical protein